MRARGTLLIYTYKSWGETTPSTRPSPGDRARGNQHKFQHTAVTEHTHEYDGICTYFFHNMKCCYFFVPFCFATRY